jgi:hypothetical protein
MNLTSEELAMLEKLGSVGMKIADCAIILEKELMAFRKVMQDRDSAAFKAYCKGYLGSVIKLRESVAELAFRGSGPSQKMMADMMGKADIETD